MWQKHAEQSTCEVQVSSLRQTLSMKNLVELIKLPLISTFCSCTSNEAPYIQGAKHNKQNFVNHLGCSCHFSLI